MLSKMSLRFLLMKLVQTGLDKSHMDSNPAGNPKPKDVREMKVA